MKWKRPISLGRTVEARAVNRPVKIAYLVPYDNTVRSHLILDAAFYESYTRWAGVYTLIVPAHGDRLSSVEYEDWLKHYDPDFVYSYVDCTPELVERIDRLCCPIAFLEHGETGADERPARWRDYLPRWNHYIQPVPSISTVQSPASYPQHVSYERPAEPTVFTQYGSGPLNRLLADNFGASYSIQNSPNPVPGLFRTLCLVPEDLPENHYAGTERCSTTAAAIQAIMENKVIPISRLAMIHSAGITRTASLKWDSSFRLFVGKEPQDRVNFWNCRMLARSTSDRTNAMILGPEVFDDEGLVKPLGQFLNKNNFLSSGDGPAQVRIHSSSESGDVLEGIKVKLQKLTHNSVRVSSRTGAPAVPSKEELEQRTHSIATDFEVLRLTEDDTDIVASEPAHFIYVPPQRRTIAEGQWIVELDIDRSNNLSRFANVADAWTLPRRRKITRAFTDRLAKPTRGGNLALLPSTGGFPFKRQAIKNPSTYELRMPSDENFFRHLALDFFEYPEDDLRSGIPASGYADMATSDKGKNLRGVISMFGSLPTAYGIMTKWYWRKVLENAKADKARPLHFDRNRLDGFIPGDRKTLLQLTEELRLKSTGLTQKYLKAGLSDTLEHLVRLNVFYQVAHWRCGYCGHLNARSFDNMKIKNQCEICSTEHFAPIDMEWQYELNDFVYRSLYKHAGLPVLWTAGFLHDNLHTGSFWYLPEVDLYDSDASDVKNEIDILCMIRGEFYAVEVKSTVSLFLNKDGAIDKFVDIVSRLRPDVALLSFEKYSNDDAVGVSVRESLKQAAEIIRNRIGPWIRLETLIAEDMLDFRDFSSDFGYHGERVGNFDRRK